MLTSVFYRAAMILTGLIVQKHILSTFGSSVNGVTSSISQFLSYLVLLEAGIGAATVQSLHKPLKDGDFQAVSARFAAGKRMYNRAGALFLLFLAVISAVLPILTFGELSPLNVALLTLISGIGNVFAYLFIGKFSSLLLADSRSGVLYLTDSVSVIASCAIRVALIRSGADILIVQSVQPIIVLLRALTVFIYVRIKYPCLNGKAEPDMTFASKRRSAMTHQIAGLVVNHTDVTILTALSTLKNVSLYSVYSYIYSSIQTLFETVFHQALIGDFGKAAAVGKEEFNRRFTLFEAVYNIALYLTLTLALCLTLPFISLYTKGITDVEYINAWLAALFCLNLFMNLIRLPSIVAVTAYGYFKETEKSAIIECAVNLGVSLMLYPFIGIYGLLIGTFTAFLFRTQDSIRFIYRRCGLPYSQLLRANIGNMAASAAITVFTFVLFPINAESWLEWLLYAVALGLTSLAVFAVANLAVNRRPFFDFWNELRRKRGNHQ